jgi:hypothetical protein
VGFGQPWIQGWKRRYFCIISGCRLVLKNGVCSIFEKTCDLFEGFSYWAI